MHGNHRTLIQVDLTWMVVAIIQGSIEEDNKQSIHYHSLQNIVATVTSVGPRQRNDNNFHLGKINITNELSKTKSISSF